MTTHATEQTTPSHGAATHGATEHAEHGMSTRGYISIALILAAITALEVSTYYVDFGPLFLPALLIMMAVKFVIVVSYFMHLKFDNKLFSSSGHGSMHCEQLAPIPLKCGRVPRSSPAGRRGFLLAQLRFCGSRVTGRFTTSVRNISIRCTCFSTWRCRTSCPHSSCWPHPCGCFARSLVHSVPAE
ncbi:MAG: hypothetical protein EBV02_05680 [Actinobacteria bacterium]|nr:hypothetical protein [Actinomycetota bacterium]